MNGVYSLPPPTLSVSHRCSGFSLFIKFVAHVPYTKTIQESPRWLIQKKYYARAAKSLNRIAWMNRRSVRFTAEMMERVVLLRKPGDVDDAIEMKVLDEEETTSRRMCEILLSG